MKYLEFIKQFNEKYFNNVETSNYKMPYYRQWAYPPLECSIKKCLSDFKDYTINNVLVIGCAKGFEIEIFELLGKKAVGIDISRFALKSDKNHLRLILGDVSYLPFRNSTFDLIYGAELLEHLPEDRIDHCIEELNRLSPLLFLTISLKECMTANDDITHVSIHDRSWWEKKLFKYYDYISYNYKFKTWEIFSMKRRNKNG